MSWSRELGGECRGEGMGKWPRPRLPVCFQAASLTGCCWARWLVSRGRSLVATAVLHQWALRAPAIFGAIHLRLGSTLDLHDLAMIVGFKVQSASVLNSRFCLRPFIST